MSIPESLFLGFLQGLTEFLPVSSSGHLVIVEKFLDLRIDPFSLQGFDVILHAGTLLALTVCYRRTWWRLMRACVVRDPEGRALLFMLILATVPGALAGLFLETFIASTFRAIRPVALSLLLTAAFLLVGERRFRQKGTVHNQPNVFTAFLAGCMQALALVPGLSRSGLTISAGLLGGLSRSKALDFSFLMAAPIIAGATMLSLRDLWFGSITLPSFPVLGGGFFVSFLVSLWAIHFLQKWVLLRSLSWFCWYLIPMSLFLLLT